MVFLIGSSGSSLWTWLGPVLAFSGSVLLFIASMITLWRTNKRADRRAARLWQRDTLLRLADDVVQAGIEAYDEYWKIYRSEDPGSEKESRDDIASRARKIAADIERLRLIGAHETARSGEELLNSIDDGQLANSIAAVYRHVRTENIASAALYGRVAERATREAQLRSQADALLDKIKMARTFFGHTAARELAQTDLGGEPRRRRRLSRLFGR